MRDALVIGNFEEQRRAVRLAPISGSEALEERWNTLIFFGESNRFG